MILLKVASNTKKLNQNQINIEKLLHIMKLTFKHIAEFALIKLFFVCLARTHAVLIGLYEPLGNPTT
jgi:hypothetical protein